MKFEGRRRTESDEGRLMSLPDELIIRIMESMPTEEACVLSFTSKRMRKLFLYSTILNFSDSSRTPSFVKFVDSVLESSLSTHLLTFRLQLGLPSDGSPVPFSDPTPSQICTWISFPLDRHSKEIDLYIHPRNPSMLPPRLFTCQTLQVLKLDLTLDLAQVCALPKFHLPNLKVLHLTVPLIPEGGLISRLVSSCPSLEKFHLSAFLNHGDAISVVSPSLRNLTLMLCYHGPSRLNVLILDTPQLENLYYSDNLAASYSITTMNVLVNATIEVISLLGEDTQTSFHRMLSLVKAATNVEHLSLKLKCFEALDLDTLNDSLPVFRNLKQLVLSQRFCNSFRWHNLLLGFLNHSPSLEKLYFPSGITYGLSLTRNTDDLDQLAFETTQEIPVCCTSSLKCILIKAYMGRDRELQVLRFLLRNSLVLEDLVISHCHRDTDQALIHDMPRASNSCSITLTTVGQLGR